MTAGSKPTWLPLPEPTAEALGSDPAFEPTALAAGSSSSFEPLALAAGSGLSFEPTALAAGSPPIRLRMMALTIGLPLLFMALYFGFNLVNSVGLAEKEMSAIVTSKQFYESNDTYTTKVVGGRSWVQISDNPGFHLIHLNADGKKLSAVVPHEEYLMYETGDSVSLRVRTYRLTGSQEVIEITSHRKQGA